MNFKTFKVRFINTILTIGFFGFSWIQKINPIIGPYKVIQTGKLFSRINESSGICKSTLDSTFWTHNDGNYPDLFEVTIQGKCLKSIELDVEFTDFEEITRDLEGNVYLGDFGNNFSDRKNLAIYKFDFQSRKIEDKISFSYVDQKKFSNSQNEDNYDCEAFFYFKDSLYLFSKNRNFKKPIRLYGLPAFKGNYTAEILDTVTLNSPVTAADISPSQKYFVLLTYRYLYFFEVNNGAVSFKKPKGRYVLGDAGQVEGICYVNESELLITNEGGKMYLLTLNQ